MATTISEPPKILTLLESSKSLNKMTGYSKKVIPKLGPFLLLKTLGTGEFGKVKLGRHVETGQTVAVKLVKRKQVDSNSQLEKILMEIDIVKTLNHPYIVKLLSVTETDNLIGMVLEYAQGGELFDYINEQKYLQENEAQRLFSQLISAVHYMHQKNVVHRDLKLENILLDRHGDLIVTDFGFANQFTLDEGDLMSTSCGSPCYAAPELVMTGRVYAGQPVDIWSCGVILYAMLSGYLPFDDDKSNPNGENIGKLYHYIMANKPCFASHITLKAQELILNMLIPDPLERCKIDFIMQHEWLDDYHYQLSRPIEDLEEEAQLKKKLLLGEDSHGTLKLSKEERDDDDAALDSSSSCASFFNPPSYGNTKDASIGEPLNTEKNEVVLDSLAIKPANTPRDEADENSQHFSNTDATIPIATICKAKTEDAAPLQLQKEKRVASPTKSMTNTLPTIVTAPNKRHTVDVTNSLRARLLSSVRRRKTSLIQRHSWQLPKEEKLVVTPEPSKSTRLISWFKHKANKTERTLLHTEKDASLHQKHLNSSLSPNYSNPSSRSTFFSKEEELNVHQGSMNRLALTSKPPVQAFLEISRIASILGLSTSVSGYKLECVRRSIEDEEENETIYGQEFHDDWQELVFSIEICRFENLSGLFCIDMQHLSGDARAYRFLGEKILQLLHLSQTIRSTNFVNMLQDTN